MRMLLNSSCSAFLSTSTSSARARISEIYESGNLNLKRFPIRLGSIIIGSMITIRLPKIKTGVNHYALRLKLYLAALKTAYQELVKLAPLSLGA